MIERSNEFITDTEESDTITENKNPETILAEFGTLPTTKQIQQVQNEIDNDYLFYQYPPQTSNKHTKFGKDNQISKIKSNCTNSIIKSFNELIRKYYKKNQKFKIRKVLPTFNSNSNKEYNKTTFLVPIRRIFSNHLSTKYTNTNPEQNKININNLSKEKCFDTLFNFTYFDFYLVYIQKRNFSDILNECGFDREINVTMSTLEDFLRTEQDLNFAETLRTTANILPEYFNLYN